MSTILKTPVCCGQTYLCLAQNPFWHYQNICNINKADHDPLEDITQSQEIRRIRLLTNN